MKQLSQGLSPMLTTANEQTPKSDLLLMLQRGLTKDDGKTNIQPWTLGQLPRDYTLTPQNVELLLSRLRQIKSYRKRVDTWIDTPPVGSVTYGKTLKVTYEWNFPEDFDHESAQSLIREASRPCGGATIKYFVALARTKKIQDIDESNADKYLMTYIRDLSGFCEIAVIAALDEIRTEDESPWFPTIAKLRNAARIYHDSVVSAQDYFKATEGTKQ